MRRPWLRLAGVTVLGSAASLLPMPTLALWNASPSVPTGLYWIDRTSRIAPGDRFAIEPPPELRRLMALRGYLPAGALLIKPLAASSGARVCRSGLRITIDARPAGLAHARDSHGRALPVWSGCHTLGEGELFFMNPAAAGSFDGRYFGVLNRKAVVGRAVPIWTDESGSGAHVWFAQVPRPSAFHSPQGHKP